MGGAVFPPCYLTWDQTTVEIWKIMVTFKAACASTAALSVPDPAAAHRQPTPVPETHVHSQASLCQSLVGSLLLSPGSWCTQGFVCAPQESVSQSCVNSIIRSHCPPKSNSLGFSVSLPNPWVGKSVVGSRTFLTVWEFLWYNCSVFVGHLLGTCMVGLMATSSKKAFATGCVTQICCTQSCMQRLSQTCVLANPFNRQYTEFEKLNINTSIIWGKGFIVLQSPWACSLKSCAEIFEIIVLTKFWHFFLNVKNKTHMPGKVLKIQSFMAYFCILSIHHLCHK